MGANLQKFLIQHLFTHTHTQTPSTWHTKQGLNHFSVYPK